MPELRVGQKPRGTPSHNPSGPWRRKEWLEYQYWKLGKSLRQIAAEVGIDHHSVLYWFNKHGIKRRPHGLGFHVSQGNHLVLSKEAKEFLCGELLGDGGVYPVSDYSAYWQQGSKYKGYVGWLSEKLYSWGIEQQSLQTHKGNSGGHQFVVYMYASGAYDCLLELRNLFYPDGKKHIPGVLELSPVVVRQWYIGDGSFHKERTRQYIHFATYSFGHEEVRQLANKLAFAIGVPVEWVNVSAPKAGPRISIGRRKAVRAFFDYIGPCPREIGKYYGYKWG